MVIFSKVSLLNVFVSYFGAILHLELIEKVCFYAIGLKITVLWHSSTSNICFKNVSGVKIVTGMTEPLCSKSSVLMKTS
jgi:hypothetical protein